MGHSGGVFVFFVR
jgi:hypothetical protein